MARSGCTSGFPPARLVLVDPLGVPDALAAVLDERRFEALDCAAGSESGEAEFNVDLDRPSLSSLLERTSLTRRDHALRRKRTRIEPLDLLVEQMAPNAGRIGLKIDTEGYEMEVLKGARAVLRQCEFVLCEVSLAERFTESYKPSQLVSWMADRGFVRRDVLRMVRGRGGAPLFADMLFRPAAA